MFDLNQKYSSIRYALFVLGIGLCVGLLFAPIEQIVFLQREFGYWLSLTLCSAAAFCVWPYMKHSGLQAWCRKSWRALLFALIVSILHGYLEEHRFKVVNDEPVLLSISKTMSEDRLAAHPTQVERLAGVLTPMGYIVDKRPLLFPFVVSVLHNVSGYRASNAFVLNAILGFGFLIGLYVCLSRWFSKDTVWSILIVWACSPLWAQNVTGGGFEVLNLCLILMLFIVCVEFIRRPSGALLSVLIAFSALLVNVRYESAIFLILPWCALLWGKFVAKSGSVIPCMPWALSVAPLALLSPMLALRIFPSNDSFLQTGAAQFVDWSHVSSNLQHAIYYLFNTQPEQSNSVFISCVGVCAVCVLPILILKIKRQGQVWATPFAVVLGFLFVSVVVHLCLLLSLNWGEWTDPTVARFTLPLHLFLILSVGLVLHLVERLYGCSVRCFTYCCGLYFVLFALPSIDRAGATQALTVGRGVEWSLDVLDQRSPDRLAYVVASASMAYTNAGHPGAMAASLVYHESLRDTIFSGLRYNELFIVERLKLNHETHTWESDLPGELQSIVYQHARCVDQYVTNWEQRMLIWYAYYPVYNGESPLDE